MSLLLPPFELYEPESVEEALKLKGSFPESDWLAGGTDLLPNYKWGLHPKPVVISLRKIEELRDHTPERLGALLRLSEIEKSPILREALPVLPRTARLVASPLLRNSGTLGGNLLLDNRCFFFNQEYSWRESKGFCLKAEGDSCLVVPQKTTCYATFSADLPAPLIALGATFELASPSGRRRVPASEFYVPDGIRRNVLGKDELLVRVHIPPSARTLSAVYHKLRVRDSFDFPECGIAVSLRVDSRGALVEGHLVANALETVPRVLDELFEPYLGSPLDSSSQDSIARRVEESVRPVKNTFLSPAYRKAMSRVLTKRAIREAWSLALGS